MHKIHESVFRLVLEGLGKLCAYYDHIGERSKYGRLKDAIELIEDVYYK